MDRIRSIVVVGAGLAGLACALAAARAEVAVQVVEIRPALASPEVQIEIVPNLLRDLQRLGVAQDCARAGFAYSRVAIADARGHVLDEVPMHRLAGMALPPAMGLVYADLLRLLAGHAEGAGARLAFGNDVVHIDADAGRVKLAGGDEVQGDLVILATGQAAALQGSPRAAAADARPMAQQWWQAIVPRPARLDAATWALGPQGDKLFWVPVSHSRAGVAWLARDGALQAGAEERVALFAAALARFPMVPATAIEALRGTSIHIRSVHEALADEWHRGRVLCVGECAHVLPPHFGQPAAQSVEDAVVLGDLLGQALDAQALAMRFTERRKARAAGVLAIARQAARWDLAPEPHTDLRALAQALAQLVAQPA